MWRGVSLRKVAVLVFAPMLTETLSTLFLAWMVLRAARTMDLAAWQHMAIPVCGSASYAISSFLAGRWVTPRAAPLLMIGAIVGVTVLGLTAMAIDTYPAFVLCGTMIGFCFGHYYTPFQINMTHVHPFRTVAWSVGFYNVAWGTGAAVGPWLGSSLRTAPLVWLIVIAAGVALAHTVLNLMAMRAPPPSHELDPRSAFNSTARQRRTGMVAFLLMNIVVRGVYITLWPELGKEHGWSDQQIGFGQFCIFAPVPLAALLWAKLRFRLRGPCIMLASLFVGLVGYATLAFTDNWALATLCAVGVGFMESCVVFHAIYYMNTDPDPRSRARNVGKFEMCAGLGSNLGPLVIGLAIWDDAGSWRPFAVGLALIVAAVVWVIWNHERQSETVAEVDRAGAATIR